jgi:DNA-binding response OmpR family regulator
MKNSRPILLVEDDDVDAMTTQRALDEIKITNKLIHKIDGEDALEYLRDEDNQKPCVILLDLNMPRMNGFDFLKIVKADTMLRRIPVIVLTTSDSDEGMVESYDLGVAGYIVKPVNYQQFVEAMKTLDMYWTLNRLPHSEQRRPSSSVTSRSAT